MPGRPTVRRSRTASTIRSRPDNQREALPAARRLRASSPILALNVEIHYRQRVLLNELTSRLDLIAHQRRENIVRRHSVLNPHLHEPPTRRINGGLPELARIHLAQPLVALDRLPLARLVE